MASSIPLAHSSASPLVRKVATWLRLPPLRTTACHLIPFLPCRLRKYAIGLSDQFACDCSGLCDKLATKTNKATGEGGLKCSNYLFLLAGGPGFEPGLAESESAVLPLDDPPPVAGPKPGVEPRFFVEGEYCWVLAGGKNLGLTPVFISVWSIASPCEPYVTRLSFVQPRAHRG